MATAFPSDDGDHRNDFDSSTRESDEVRSMHCEDCEKDLGTFITANGFCVLCYKFLCSTCVRYHNKQFPKHKLQDSSIMPQDYCFDKCPKHPREILKFYCNNCELEICSQCKVEDHSWIQCLEVFHIPTSLHSDQMTNELKEVTQSMGIAFDKLAVRRENTKRNLIRVQTNRDEVDEAIESHKYDLIYYTNVKYKEWLQHKEREQSEEIKAYEKRRAEIIARLDKEKDDLLERHQKEDNSLKEKLKNHKAEILQQIDTQAQNLHKMKENDVHKLELVLSDFDKAEAKVKELEMTIEKNKITGEKCKLFVAVKKVISEMKRYNLSEDKNFNKESEIVIHQFLKKNNNINLRFPENEISFGYLQDLSKTIVRFVQEDEIQLKPCSKDNVIGYKMCKTRDHLVIVEEEKFDIKLVNLRDKNVKSSMPLPHKPYDVTNVDTNDFATTLTSAKKIQVLTITRQGDLSLVNNIHIGKECYGIGYMKPYLIVACQHPGSVEILLRNGVHIKSLINFNNPLHVLVDQNNCAFYITDKINPKTETIKKINYSLKIETVSEKLYCSPNNHSSLFVENNGFVYMFESQAYLGFLKEGGKLFFKFSKDLQRKASIDSEMLTDQIVGTFFCREDNKLYVGNTQGEISKWSSISFFSRNS
ncbi:uncharacterized protein LOC132716758 [Ruditapes philippinarum]|uniref:uncharacterized protein LOC132716758 n=1 Tax=Ruditapes philippinarum TaxID=129788 RepID=UPI00295BF30D|nr:uncharacterized protein LOC132716758 [Ruditapes philippinarum]